MYEFYYVFKIYCGIGVCIGQDLVLCDYGLGEFVNIFIDERLLIVINVCFFFFSFLNCGFGIECWL